MRTQRIGDIDVYRPHQFSDEVFFAKARRQLAKLQLPTATNDQDTIERVLDSWYAFCEGEFQGALTTLASRGLVEFVLGQLALWHEVHQAGALDALSPEDKQAYSRWGPSARLALQFTAEAVTRLYEVKESPPVSADQLDVLLDQLMIAAEEMARASALITTVKGLFRDRCRLSISWESGSLGFDVAATDPKENARWQGFLTRGQFKGQKDLAKLEEPAPVARVLDHFGPVFQSEHGLSLRDAFRVAGFADTACTAGAKAFDVKFCKESQLYAAVAHNSGIDEPKVRLAFAGLTLTQERLNEEDRELWKPKQQGRLLRRPFLRVGHPTGSHLCWHSSNISTSLPYLTQELCSGRVPDEWSTPIIEQAAEAFARTLDIEWEQTAFDTMRDLGLAGDLRIKKLLRSRGNAIPIPAEVGEIDLLMFDAARSVVCVIEVKRIQPTYGPSQFRDDVSKFISGGSSYVDQLKRKVRWVRANIQDVMQHLSVQGVLNPAKTGPVGIQGGIVTKYESFAQVQETTVPILSLRSLVEQRRSFGTWPFADIT